MKTKKNIENPEGKAGHCMPDALSLEPQPRLGEGEMIVTLKKGLYAFNDLTLLQAFSTPRGYFLHNLSSIDELLARDLQREKDGFPRKIRIGRLIKVVKGGKEKIVIVPTTVEEKLYHDTREEQSQQEEQSGGSGEGEEDQVIGEEPVHGSEGSGTGGAGQGEGGEHEIESSAFDLGRILTEKFALPNLTEKGKKRSLKKFTYDLTDRHRGFGQVLDKKATLRRIIETNISLNTLPNLPIIDPTRLLVTPQDFVYRILSKEQDFESQAMVFFVRDYSGSMSGKPTELVVTQHVFIYSWLLFQYDRQVETRFILHDTEAKEVPDFNAYSSLSVAGGTKVVSAYRLINEMVEKENLARDYNIYVFHGTDGDDWDADGKETIPELRKMAQTSSRVGITVANQGGTVLERNLRESKVLEEYLNQLRLDVMEEDVEESRLIEGIRRLIS
ncbi:MAG: hypothetical protein C0407_04805 [Desulfobacca sp.]|nr:hypothetical protein [Desulfobacca sp.]